MKVALISFGHVDNVIGLAKHMAHSIEVELYIILAQTSKQDTILNFEDIAVPDGLLDEGLTAELLSCGMKRYIEGKFKIYIFIYHSNKTYSINSARLSYQLANIIKKNGCDLIHFYGNDLRQIWLSIFISKTPKVYTIHDYLGHSGERVIWLELFNKWLVNSNRYKIMLCKWNISQAHKDKAVKKYKINFIPFGLLEVYKIWQNNSMYEEKDTIIFFGRISPYKGIEYLIKAVPQIKKEIPDLKVILAGGGNYYFNIERLKNDNTYHIINRVVSGKDLVALIQKAGIVVCPYKDATQSGVVMTAYALNKPVVASAVGGIPEVVEDGVTGILVPPGNSLKLADAIIELLKDSKKRRFMAENIKNKFCQGEYAWKNIAKRTVELYKMIIQKGR